MRPSSLSGLSVKLFIIPMTPPRNERISTISIGVRPVSLRYSPPAEKGPVSGPPCVGALLTEGREGLEGRRPVRILASRICRSDSKSECNSEGEARSDAALLSSTSTVQLAFAEPELRCGAYTSRSTLLTSMKCLGSGTKDRGFSFSACMRASRFSAP